MSTPPLPTDHVIKALGHLVQKAEGGKPVFRMTSEVLDRHRDRVKPTALKTESYLKNPVLLWNHNDWEPAIGTCRVFQEGGEWFMEPAFDNIGERSKEVAAKVAASTLRTCSIRFRILKYAYNEEGGYDYEEVELLEVSITNIPANPEAERVKTQNPQQPQPQKNAAPPPEPEQTASKALEQADVGAIQAMIAEALKPLLEKLTAIEALCQSKMAEEQTEPEEPEAEKENGAEGDDEDSIEVEMSEEEAQEMKAFLTPPAPPKGKS